MKASRLNTHPRVLEMGLKRVYTLLRSWNRLEDFDQIFWGQKSALAGQWLPHNLLVAPFHYNPWSPWVLAKLTYIMPDFLTEALKMTKIKMGWAQDSLRVPKGQSEEQKH